MLSLWIGMTLLATDVGEHLARRIGAGPAPRDERGQASAEYALVLLGAAAVALLIVSWATKTDLVGKLLDKVMKAVSGKVA